MNLSMVRTWLKTPSAFTNLALILLGAMLLGFSHHLVVEFDHFVIGYSETSTCALAIYAGACAIVLLRPVDRLTLWIVIAFAILARLVLLTPEPYLSTDIDRYVWDGMVQHHGINPYRFVPGDPHLAFMRDDDIFPNINRRDYAPTIYPPVAQMLFFVSSWLSPTLVMMKLVMAAMECLTVLVLSRLLQAMGRRREEVILYAWSPLCIWEIGSSGHLDAAVTAAILLALFFRWKDWRVLTGLALGAAVMLKFYPLLLFPALWRRRDWKMPAALSTVVAVGYATYSSVGIRVFGFASGYATEEGMSSGSRYYLLELAQRLPGLAHLPTPAFYVFCVLVFVPLLAWCWRVTDQGGTAFLRPAAYLAFALMLLFSPHYPWYVIWLVPFFTLLRSLPMTVYVYSVFYWLTTQYAMPGPGLFFADGWIYAATAAAALMVAGATVISRRRAFARPAQPQAA